MILRFSDHELDTRGYELRHAGVPVAVEPQVLDVLIFLAAHHDRVVSRDELLDAVWGHRFVSEATVSSRIKLARRAVSDSGEAQAVIRTIRGRGYRFVAALAATGPGADPRPAGSIAVARAAARPIGIVGREAELARLEALFARAVAGERGVAWITGEAGIGKSTLLSEFLSGLPPGGAIVARGQCIRRLGTGEPYMPVIDALARLARDPADDIVERALRAHAPSWAGDLPGPSDADGRPPASGAQGGWDRRLRELVAALDHAAEERPLVLALEDMHWSDPSTLDLVVALARRPQPAAVLVIATYRPADARAALPELVTVAQELAIRGAGEMIELDFLDERALAAYLAARFPGSGEHAELARLLHRRTDGNPLFATCVLDAWLADGDLSANGGALRIASDLSALASRFPASLGMLLDAEVRALEPTDQAILEAAAAAGVEFAAALAAAGAVADPPDAEARLSRLARDGRLVRAAGAEEWPDGTVSSRFAFIHQLHQEALYDRIPAGARARVHQLVGTRLEEAFGDRAAERSIELADHFERARDSLRAARYLHLAGLRALVRQAWTEAVVQLRAAHDALDRLAAGPERDADELDLLLALAPALLATNGWRSAAAEEAYQRARDLGRRLGDEMGWAGAMFGLAVMHEVRGEFSQSEALLVECVGSAAPDSTDLPDYHELMACSLVHQGSFARALEQADTGVAAVVPGRVSRLTGPHGEDPLVGCHDWAALAHFFLDQPEAAQDRIDAALRTAGTLGLGLATARMEAARLAHLGGDAAAAGTAARAALAVAHERGFPYQEGFSEVVLGWSEVHEGSPDSGLARIRAGLARHEASGAVMDQPYLLGVYADALSRADRPGEARAQLDEALAQMNPARPFFYEAALLRQRGELRVAQRDTAGGRADLQAAVAVARRQGSPALERRARAGLAALGAVDETTAEGAGADDPVG